MERVWYVRGMCRKGVACKDMCGERVCYVRVEGVALKICLFYSSSEHTECG